MCHKALLLMSVSRTKIVLDGGVVHIVYQLLGKSIQLFFWPGGRCPLLSSKKKQADQKAFHNSKLISYI